MGQVFDLDLPRPEAWVLMALVDHAEHDGSRIFPSIDYVAWKTGYKRRQVQNIIRSLHKRGVLALVREARDHRPREYRADFATATRKPERRAESAPPRDDRGAVTTASRAVQSRDNRGAIATAPEPSVEPSLQPSERSPDALLNGPQSPGGEGDDVESGEPAGLLAAFRELCPKLPQVRQFNAHRQQAAAKALKTHHLAYWREVFTRAAGSTFLHGDNPRGWRADFDWFLSGTGTPNAEKVLEGKFDTVAGNAVPRPTAASSYRDFPMTNGVR